MALLDTGITLVRVFSTGLNLAHLLLYIVILVLAVVEDVLPPDGADVVREDVEVDEDDQDGHDGADPLDGLALEAEADVDGGEGEADVGEDEGPPVQAEAQDAVGGETADDGDGEEPQRQAPDEDGREQGEQTHDLGNDLVVGAEEVVPARPVVRQPDQRQRRETRRAHGDEHARPRLGRGQAERDHAPRVARVHEDGHQHAQPLSGQAAEQHGRRVLARLELDARSGDRPRQHHRQNRQVPRRRHVLDLEPRVGEEHAVQADSGDERAGEVRPEQHAVDDDEPIRRRACIHIDNTRDPVLGHAADGARHRQERAPDEQRLLRVHQAGLESARPPYEPVRDGRDRQGQDDQVPHVHDLADGL